MSKNDTYQVPEYNLPALEAAIEKLNRKAAKLNTDPITLEVIEHTEQETEFGPMRFYRIRVNGPEPIIAGWALIAKLEPASEGNVIKTIGDYTEVPKEYRTARIWCDHCDLERARASSWLVCNVVTNEYKQVGTGCLADFTGHGDPALFVARAEWLRAAMDAAQEAADYDPDYVGGAAGPARFYLDQYLAWVSATIKAHGWCSRSKVYNGGGTATADAALYAWTKPAQYRKADAYSPDETDEQQVKEALEWARGPLAERDDLSDYEHNLVLVCAENSIPHEWVGIAASLIATYGRHKETQIRIEKEGVSEWQGTIKKRQVWGPLILTAVHSFASTYGGYGGGTYYIYKFQDEAGNVYIWKTGNGYGNWQQGDQFAGKATVKAHDEYRGVKQTTLTRCAFEVVEPVAA